MPYTHPREYAPPISLRDLVNVLGVDTLGAIIAGCADAVLLQPKRNERWRYALYGCVIVGYRTSATVTGERSEQLHLVAAAIRKAAQGFVDASLRVREAAQAMRTFIEQCIAVQQEDHEIAAGITLVVAILQELQPQERIQAYWQLAQSLPTSQARTWYVQIVEAVISAYTQGMNDVALYMDVDGTATPEHSRLEPLMPDPFAAPKQIHSA